MGTEKATVLPVPVRDPPIQSLPFKISGMVDFWMLVGVRISIDANEETSQGVTPIEENVVFSEVTSCVEGRPEEVTTVDGFGFFALMREVTLTGGGTASGGESLLLLREPSCSSMTGMAAVGTM